MHWLSQSNYWCGSGFFFNGPLGMVLSLLFWGGIIFLGVRCARFLLYRPFSGQPSGMAVLQERYAKGEVDEETYLKMKQELQS